MKKGIGIIFILAMIFGLIIFTILIDIQTQTDITPNDEFFVISISDSPEIDVDDWTLKLFGMVDYPLNLTYENITTFPITSEIVTLKCVAGPSGTANWTGIKLKALLNLAGLKENATEVIFYAVDGYSSSLTVDDAFSDDVIIAFEMNGETLPQDHGYPVRLVVPGKYGYKWVKWITIIEVIDYDYKGYWEKNGYDDDADISTGSNYWIHSILLTTAAYFGSLALLSGLKFSDQVKFGKRLPDIFSKKFHMGTSLIYLSLLISVALYQILFTLDVRGKFPNSPHGILALVVLILAFSSNTSGFLLRRKIEKVRIIHLSVTLFCFLLILGTIITGLILAFFT